MKKILVVTYGGGHARMLKPVIQRLQKLDVKIQILALNTAEAEFEGMGLDVFGYRHFFQNSKALSNYGKKLAVTLDKIVNHDETVAYLGANYLELVNRYGTAQAADMYESGGRYIFEPSKTMEYILKRIRPDLLITTNSPRSEKYAVLAARKLEIKSVAFIDMFGIRCESWFKDNSFADKILVLSESVKQNLISLGRDISSITVVGNPSFDTLANNYYEDKNNILEARQKMPFTILWASQPEPAFLPETGKRGKPELPIKIESVLLPIFKKYMNWSLIIRNHPSEASREYPNFIKRSVQSDPFEALLKKVHVVLTPSSTVGFQGVIMGAKLVTIDTSVLTPTMPYAKMGYSIGLTNIDQIEPTLLRLEKEKGTSTTPPYTIRTAADNAIKEIVNLLG